ncbi:hypothetical protein H5410_030155 [Solanum commersonii]|uniref:Uncharacterized protein n=1 Tax=Solanum commersonii TaxID=4109 RepID=A0A9J5YEU2_SOLCO|nr:hypothetical protein H5410_030155 [Solanum commersonii]
MPDRNCRSYKNNKGISKLMALLHEEKETILKNQNRKVERIHKKKILQLNSQTGTRLTYGKEIRPEIVELYKNLTGTTNTSLPAVNTMIMRNDATLSHQQRIDTCPEVSEKEIFSAL